MSLLSEGWSLFVEVKDKEICRIQASACGFKASQATTGLFLIRLFSGLVLRVQHTDNTDRPSLSETPQLFCAAGRDYVLELEHISHFHLQ